MRSRTQCLAVVLLRTWCTSLSQYQWLQASTKKPIPAAQRDGFRSRAFPLDATLLQKSFPAVLPAAVDSAEHSLRYSYAGVAGDCHEAQSWDAVSAVVVVLSPKAALPDGVETPLELVRFLG